MDKEIKTWIIDESSYRTDKTAFPTEEEAIQKAGEAARILGRPIAVYKLMAQDFAAENTHPTYDSRLQHAGRVHPDGTWEEGDSPLAQHEAVQPTAPAVLGMVIAELDAVAEELEAAGERELSTEVDQVAAELAVSKKRTFAQARKEIFDFLKKKGWKLVDHLKIPHATSPDGDYRLWFKTQAVYMSKGRHRLGDARSTWIDIRDVSPDEFMLEIESWMKRL